MNNLTASSTDFNFSNETQHQYEPLGYLFFSKPFTVFIIVAYILVIIVAIIGNTLVCIATGLNPNLRKASTSLFIVSLAVSDLLTATLSIPFDVYTLRTNGLWFQGWEIWRSLPKYVIGEICFFNGSPCYNIMVSVLNFVLPALAMCSIYLMIYRQIRRHTCTVHPADSTTPSGPAKFLLQRNIRAAKRIALIVSVFLISWVPFSVLSIIGNICLECHREIPLQIYYVTLLMGYSNSALNPFLYSFNNRNFIDSYTRLYRAIRKACRRRSNGK
ncbi:5-hydroxytryptamine receptor 1-like isoform X2 [Acropora millepora]|uniref:5-hydroxytryptamine receptor 1-like isoform X2 n=1 Tax=Acropora millepora TaxID=45264 RepID=UPI0010FCB88A|nr:5-hydroxytryptamine receptor 1-like isoform X2 [Acropora millepora]